jgi:hypothetical protein
MSHATGKVKFPNGEVKCFEYDATVSYVCTRLRAFGLRFQSGAVRGGESDGRS